MAAKTRAVTRATVLSESLDLFATYGYRFTSLERVAERLGVTRQAIYYHFHSKDAILAALFEEMMVKLETAAKAAAQSEDKPRFTAMLRAHLRETVNNTSLVALLLHERPEIANISTLNAGRRRRDYAHLFVDAYEEGVKSGDLRAMDSWIAVNALIAGINGISWWYHGEPGSPAGQQARGSVNEEIFALMSSGFLVRRQGAPPQ